METTIVEPGTLSRLVESEINQQVATAKKYPRSLQRFADEAMAMVTLDKATANECMYALPRDGKSITGPSARFAEIAASCWGNNRAGARVVDVGDQFVTAQGVFHDLERNVAVTIEVQRRITDKSGRRYKEDMIGVTGNAAVSIALRNAVLKGIPKAFWAPAYDAALRIIRGDASTLADRRDKALDYLSKTHAVSAERVCAALEVEGKNDIGLDELMTLRGMLQAINDGDTTADQAFPEVAARSSSSNGLNERIKRDAEREAAGQAGDTGGAEPGPTEQQEQVKTDKPRKPRGSAAKADATTADGTQVKAEPTKEAEPDQPQPARDPDPAPTNAEPATEPKGAGTAVNFDLE